MRRRPVRLKEDWVIPGPWIAWAMRYGMGEQRARLEAEKMRDWSLSSPKGAMLDWFAAWRNWVRRAMVSGPVQVGGRGSEFEEQLRAMRGGDDGKRD